MTKLSLIPISLALVAGIAHADAPKGEKAEKQVAAKPPEMPKPSQEMVDMIKGMSGTWKCTGQAEIMGTMMDVKATITHKSDLNGWWVRSDFTGTAGKLPPMKFTMYTTYDATTKKLWRTQASAMGNHSVSTGTMADKKVSWEGDAHWSVGDVKTRATEEMVSAKEVHIVGEYSKDGGKTWSKDHEATCKK